jgi:hypothetical protein
MIQLVVCQRLLLSAIDAALLCCRWVQQMHASWAQLTRPVEVPRLLNYVKPIQAEEVEVLAGCCASPHHLLGL